MRVLMFGWEFPPHISGGLGTACYGMTRGLSRKGVDVLFVLPRLKGDSGGMDSHLHLLSASGTRMDGREARRLSRATLDVWQKHIAVKEVDSFLAAYDTEASYRERLKMRTEEGSVPHTEEFIEPGVEADVTELHGGYGPDLMSEVYRYGKAAAALALREAEGEGFDVIHAHDWMTYPAGMLAKAMTGKPLVVHLHATEYDRSGEHVNEAVAAVERAGLQAADLVIAVSHLTRNIAINRYGVPPEKVVVVYNAVSRRNAGERGRVPALCQKEKRVLFLGRVTFQKGPEYFVEAARMVLDRMPNVRFVMAGSGDMLPSMVRRVSQLRMGSRFHFAGFMRGAEVDRMYALSDLYVMPSVSEPFGIAPLEAMLYDVPVLLSRQSGVSEILHNALKVDFWDTREMANKICAVLSYPKLAGEMVRNCREELKSITWDRAADGLVDAYNTVCRSK